MEKNIKNISVVIPSLEPTPQLINYINDLLAYGIEDIIVVDDGSGERFKTVFEGIREIAGCTVLTHTTNQGKGDALKSAFAYVAENRPHSRGVVTVDSDGQHAVGDVYRVASLVLEDHEGMVLGCRDFSLPHIPTKSRVGNRLTSGAMFLTYGKWFKDTQTGLRGFGAALLPFVGAIEGARFDYEMRVLSEAVTQKIPIHSIMIETIYENNNEGTHFRPIKDSFQVISALLGRFVRFMTSALLGTAVDLTIAWFLLDTLRSVLPHHDLLRITIALLTARMCSMGINYTVNRLMVFERKGAMRHSRRRYIILAIGILALSIGSVYIGSHYLGMNEKLLKIVADSLLFLVSYQLQSRWVFNNKAPKPLQWDIIRRNLFILITVVLTTLYLLWRVFFTLPWEESFLEIVFGIMLVSAESITALTTFELYYRKIKVTHQALGFPEVAESLYPDVDVFIATHNEDVELLYKTASACTFMDYPDKTKVHIYFCDDGNRPEVARLAQELGIGYLGLANNEHAKSGNLNNALAKTQSPLIATFDADMIPQRTFLMKTVPYFFLDTYIEDEGVWRLRTEEERKDAPKIGLIQTPQSFYNPDLFQFNLYSEDTIPNEQDFFSREVNIMRNAANAVAYTGSNTVIARQAMVDIGGFPLHTITEDFETSVRIQKENYITYATTEVQAAGLTTTTFQSMIKQRKRWAQGVIQSLQNTNAMFTRKLPFSTNISYLCGYLYWWSFLNRMVFLLAPILFALFDFQIMNATVEALLMMWLPSYTLYTLSFRYLFSNIRTNKWSQTIDTIFAPYMITCVFLESLGIHERKFKVTNKQKEEQSNLKYAIPHIVLMLLSVLAFIRFSYGKYGWELLYSGIILFWLSYNIVTLSYALFFMSGRRAYRKNERIKVAEKVTMTFKEHTFEGMTIDLSDDGMLFKMGQPTYIPPKEIVSLRIETPHYACDLKGQIVYVKKVEDVWHYAMAVTPVSEADKRQYLQVIYDRHHTLPTKINAWATIYDDIYRNIQRRLKKEEKQRRKLVRIPVEQTVTFKNGAQAYAHDFNYEYMALSNLSEAIAHTIYELFIDDTLTLFLQPTAIQVQHTEMQLFQVLNTNEILESNMEIEVLLHKLQQQ